MRETTIKLLRSLDDEELRLVQALCGKVLKSRIEDSPIKVAELEVSDRIKKILIRNDITNLRQLSEYRECEVLSWAGLGQETLTDIRLEMYEHGIKFRRTNY